MLPIDPLEERRDRMLNLVPYFDGRYIQDPSDWRARIFPELSRFICVPAIATGVSVVSVVSLLQATDEGMGGRRSQDKAQHPTGFR